LREIGDLRLTLDMDLTVAAAAMDDDRSDITADVIERDRAELHDFAARAARHLEAAQVADETAAADILPVPAPRSNRRRRTMLSASQAVLAAAACAAVFAGVIPGGSAPSTRPIAHTQMEASYAAFAHAARTGSDPQRLVALGASVNRSIRPLIATATNDPVKAIRMLRILQEEQRLLLRLNPAGSAKLLAEARSLLAQLTAVLDAAALLEAPADSSTTADDPAVAEPTPGNEPEPAASESPADSSVPTDQPVAEPQPQDTPTPGPTPTEEPAPAPTISPPFPFGVDVA
jgi:hypothetical protein